MLQYAAGIPEFYDAINNMVAKQLSLLDREMTFLVRNPRLLNMANKCAWLRHQLNKPAPGWSYSAPPPLLAERAPNAGEEAVEQLLGLCRHDLQVRAPSKTRHRRRILNTNIFACS